MRLKVVAAVLAVFVLAAAGCGDDDDDEDSAAASGAAVTQEALDGRNFVSTEVEGWNLVAGTEVTLDFDEGGLSVDAGCNQQFGQYEIGGDVLEIEVMASTMMGCSAALAAQDAAIADLLTSGPTIALDGATLTITGDDVTLTAEEDN
jgi:heat shock protein HslJ